MNKDKTLDEIRREGLEALKKRLGVAGMVRFLQQFEHGSGDYTQDRQKWAQRISMEEIRSLAKSSRKARKIRKAG